MDANDHAHQEPDEGQRFVDPSSKGDAQKPSGGEASPETVSSSVFLLLSPTSMKFPSRSMIGDFRVFLAMFLRPLPL